MSGGAVFDSPRSELRSAQTDKDLSTSHSWPADGLYGMYRVHNDNMAAADAAWKKHLAVSADGTSLHCLLSFQLTLRNFADHLSGGSRKGRKPVSTDRRERPRPSATAAVLTIATIKQTVQPPQFCLASMYE